MAASCVSVSLSVAAGSFVAGRGVEISASRQTSRLTLVAPSLSVSCSVEKSFASGLFTLNSRSRRNVGIAARAADLEEAEAAVESVPSTPAPAAAGTKLYVGNLPWAVHSQQLAEIFQEHGNVELVEVIYDRDTQKSRGFAFVTMSTNEDAQRAIDALDGSELDGRMVKVNFPQTTKDASRSERVRSERPARERRDGEGYSRPSSYNSAMKIFVGNLSWGVDDVALDELFSEYGKVVEAKVVHDKATGRSRGFGFVTMTKETEVASAIEALDGAEFDGRTMRVNRAGDKPERSESPRGGY